MYKRKIEKSEKCLNCEEPLSGENFCPNCGQLNNERKPNVFELFFEMLSNLFAFDSKFYRSVGPLLFKPGALSVAFVQGKRQQYMLPIRMFIVITILFLSISSIDNRINYDSSRVSTSPISDSTTFGLGIENFDKITELLRANDTLTLEEGLMKLDLEPTFINKVLYQQVQKFIHSGTDNFIDYLFSKFLIYSLLFIPFLATLLKFFYLNLSKYFYIDHFIFAVHQQTVLMTFMLIYIITQLFFDSGGLLTFLLVVAFPIHLLIALKKFYNEAWWLTVFKFILVNIGFFFISAIFVVLAGMATFLLY